MLPTLKCIQHCGRILLQRWQCRVQFLALGPLRGRASYLAMRRTREPKKAPLLGHVGKNTLAKCRILPSEVLDCQDMTWQPVHRLVEKQCPKLSPKNRKETIIRHLSKTI